MFVKTPAMFYFLRFLMGVFEAGFYPGIILYLTYWYPSERRAKAFGIFMSASAIAGVIGGPLAGSIMNSLHGVNGWSGWQWVFLIEGVPSIIAGFVTWFYLTDRPEQAKWLTPEQRRSSTTTWRATARRSAIAKRACIASLKDRRMWLLILIFFCIIAANSSLTFFGPSVVKEVGFTNPATVGWIMALLVPVRRGRHGLQRPALRPPPGERGCTAPSRRRSARSACALTALFMKQSPMLALAAQTLAIVGTMSAIPVFWQLPGRFLAGAAAAGGVALINSIANLAGFGAPSMLGVIKTSTGLLSPGLFIVAAVEICAAILIIAFVPRFVKKAVAAMSARTRLSKRRH